MQNHPLVLLAPMYVADRHCGYCKGQKEDHWALESWRKNSGTPSSITIGTSVEQMTCHQYDTLMNKGFRRSGTFLYKPDLLRNCCRMYTIRTTMDQMKIAKLHRQVVNRFSRAIADTEDNKSNNGMLGKTKNKEGTTKFCLTSLITAEQRSSRFYTRYEPAVFSEEKFALYKKYQMCVHNDKENDVTEEAFERFLCDTPFLSHEKEGTPEHWSMLNNWISSWKVRSTPRSATERHIGPTHECYYLDDKLIAISVMDFLPTGVSSVYFIWDPDFAHLSLGTLSGLREIIMCKELGLGFYYLGYYIEDCQKMKYKGQFGGELLDVCSGQYYLLENISRFIANGRFFTVGSETPIQNFSETLFGDSSPVYKEAELARRDLEKQHSVSKPTRKLSTFPDVVPGLASYLEILAWYESGAINKNFRFYIFLTVTGMRSSTEGEMSAKDRRMFVDTVRLIGLELSAQAILVTFP